MAWTSLAAVLAALVSTARLAGTRYPYLVRWWWLVAAMCWLSVAWGVLVLLREPRRTAASDGLRRKLGEAPATPILRDYGILAMLDAKLGLTYEEILAKSQLPKYSLKLLLDGGAGLFGFADAGRQCIAEFIQ